MTHIQSVSNIDPPGVLNMFMLHQNENILMLELRYLQRVKKFIHHIKEILKGIKRPLRKATKKKLGTPGSSLGKPDISASERPLCPAPSEEKPQKHPTQAPPKKTKTVVVERGFWNPAMPLLCTGKPDHPPKKKTSEGRHRLTFFTLGLRGFAKVPS